MSTQKTITLPTSLAHETEAYALPISQICTEALRAAVAEAEDNAGRIVVRTKSGLEGFYGKWIVDPYDDESRTTQAQDPITQEFVWDSRIHWGVAVTRRGKVVVYQREDEVLKWYHTLPDALLPADIREKAANGTAAPNTAPTAALHEDW